MDVTQSMFQDITSAANGDKARAAELAAQLQKGEDFPEQVQELSSMFPLVPAQKLRDILARTGGSVEAAIADAFGAQQTAEQRQKKAGQLREQKEHYSRRAREGVAAGLLRTFGTLRESTVQRILDEKEGDIDAATDALLALAEAQQGMKGEREAKAAAEKEIQERRLRQLQLEALAERFDTLTQQEVEQELVAANWDMQTAAERCLDRDRQRKVDRLAAAFKNATAGEIANVLVAHRWNETDAANALAKSSKKQQATPTPAAAAAPTPAPAPAPTPAPASSRTPASVPTPTAPSLPVPIAKKQPKKESLAPPAPTDEERRQLADDIQKDLAKSRAVLVEEQERDRAEFRERIAHIVSIQAHGTGAMPGAQPAPLPKRIDDLLREQEPERAYPVRGNDDTSGDDAQSNLAASTFSELAVTLRVQPTSVDAGNDISVQWEASTPSATSSWDWIAMYRHGEDNIRRYVTYQWRGSNAKSGVVVFKAPPTYGDYVFKYLPNNRYEALATSATVSVGPEIELFTNVVDGADAKKVTVQWELKSGNAPYSPWLGLFNRAEPNQKQYLTYEYAGKAQGRNSAGVVFTLPVKPGHYEVRFFPGSTEKYACSTRSASFRVDGEDKLQVTEVSQERLACKVHVVSVDPSSDKAWVGVYLQEEENMRRPRRYKWVGSERDGEIVFTSVPIHGGTYVVRLMASNYQVLCESAPFVLKGTV